MGGRGWKRENRPEDHGRGGCDLDPRRKRTDVKKRLGPESILKPPGFADRLDVECERKRRDLETQSLEEKGLSNHLFVLLFTSGEQ